MPLFSYIDLTDHPKVWRRHLLPLFTIVGAVLLFVFVILRTGSNGSTPLTESFVPARIGLLATGADDRPAFDGRFAVLSPLELALAPSAPVFSPPLDGFSIYESASAIPVRSAAEGRVAFAGPVGDSPTVVLVHERNGTPIETRYAGLGQIHVPVGQWVRRGQTLGTVAPAEKAGFRFSWSLVPALPTEEDDTVHSDLPPEWLVQPPDRLSAPPEDGPGTKATLRVLPAGASAQESR